MFYRVMRFFLRLAYRVYYRRIFISGGENVPNDVPVIYASNHPNSFKDAVIIGFNVKRPMTTLVRSDVFNTPVARFLLGLWNLAPVYRIQEGAENLKKNEETFNLCCNILKAGGTILIFSEGLCITEKRLRPLKKGTARIALATALDVPELRIVPVGINYDYLTEFHKDLSLSFGKPLRVSEYLNEYRENQARAANHLTADIATAIEKELVIIRRREDEQLCETLFQMVRGLNPLPLHPWRRNDRMRLQTEQKVADRVNHAAKSDPDKLARWNRLAERYRDKLNALQADDEYLDSRPLLTLARALFLLLAFPLFIAGSIINFLPVKAGRMIADKKVKVIEFYASVRLGAGYLLYLLAYGILLTWAISTFNYIPILAVLSIPFVSILAARYRYVWTEVSEAVRHSRIRKQHPEEFNQSNTDSLFALRAELVAEVLR